MNCPIQINTIWLESSIVYFKGLQVEISISCISVHNNCFILEISADLDEMSHFAAFYLGFHYIFPRTRLGVHRIQRVKHISLAKYSPLILMCFNHMHC